MKKGCIGEWGPVIPGALFLAAVFGLCFYGLFAVCANCAEQGSQSEALHGIVVDTKPLIEDCKAISGPVYVKGKPVVWFFGDENEYLYDGNGQWKTTWEYGKHDNATVFLVSTSKLDKVASYELEGSWSGRELATGYRARYDVHVIYWPDKGPVGTYTIFSDPPDSYVVTGNGTVSKFEIVGDSHDVFDWIEGLPEA